MNCRLLSRSKRRLLAGFSLVEVMIASSVLTIGLLALSSTSVVIHSLDRADEARRLATLAMQDTVERIKSFSAGSVDDPAGWAPVVAQALRAGGSIGPTFVVQGLDPWDGNPTVGTIQVITDESRSDTDLGITLGMPRDLNGDGDTGDADVTSDAALLPIIVRTRWLTGGGQRESVAAFYLTDM